LQENINWNKLDSIFYSGKVIVTVKKAIWLLLLIFIVSINIVGCNKSSSTSGQGNQNPAGQGQVQNVSIIKVDKADLTNTISIVGTVLPSEEVKVSPKSSGRIAWIQKDVGQEVSAGETLIELDSGDLSLAMEKTRLQLDDAKRILDQKQTLLDAGAISQNEYKTAENTYQTLQLTMQQNESDLANTQIKSPINGIIAARNVNLGETVTSSTTAFTIVNIDKVEIKAKLMEDEVNFVNLGQEADIAVPALSSQTCKGNVAKISPYASDADKTYPVWVEVENTERVLKPGMFAEIKLQYTRLANVIAVPKDSIVDEGDKKVVFVVNQDKAAERQVKAGITLNGTVEITEGLNSGDVLITSGLNTITDGKSVSAKAEGN
jgi:RND family efflux transporter, MFP subunit